MGTTESSFSGVQSRVMSSSPGKICHREPSSSSTMWLSEWDRTLMARSFRVGGPCAHPRIRHGGKEISRPGQDPRPGRVRLGLRDSEGRKKGTDVDAVDLLEAAPGSVRDSDRH